MICHYIAGGDFDASRFEILDFEAAGYAVPKSSCTELSRKNPFTQVRARSSRMPPSR